MRRLTLGDKMLLAMGALLAFSACIRAVTDSAQVSEAYRAQFMRIGKDHARNMAYLARQYPLVEANRERLEQAAQLLHTPEDTDLLYVAFYGADGRLVACRTWSTPPGVVPQQVALIAEPAVVQGPAEAVGVEHYRFLFPVIASQQGGRKDKVFPVVASPPVAGVVAAARSYRDVRLKACEEQASIALVTAATLAICLNILLVFARRLVAPIGALVKGTERIAAGDFSTPVDVGSRRDELRTLADSFNRMTEQLKAQHEQIMAHSRELEQKVAARTQELVQANARIREAQAELVQSEKMRMLGQLSAGVAHEINTPTAAILNVAADLQDHLRELVEAASQVPGLPPDTRQWVESMVPRVLGGGLAASEAAVRTRRQHLEQCLRQAGRQDYRRLAAVVIKSGLEDHEVTEAVLRHLSHEPVLVLLEKLEAASSAAGITRVSAEKIARIVKALRFYTRGEQAELIEADVNETIDNTLTILQNRIKHIAEVQTRYGKDLPPVRCGADISQVWTNILNNACDAIEEAYPGGMGHIRIATMLDGQRVRVTLSNDGRPIPDDVRQKMFDPFFTTKGVGKGTGLGLGICTGILRQCGGTICARNDPDGVTFEVTLPVAPSAADSTGQSAAAAPAPEPQPVGRAG